MEKPLSSSFFISFFIFIYQFGFTQSVKQYKGYASYMYIPGTETYSYFEKEGERIKHGKYSFIGKLRGYSEGISYNSTLKITGYFKKGSAEGLWIYNQSIKRSEGSGTIIFKINYKNNLPDGISTYKLTGKKGGNSYYSKGKCTFREGKFVGNYYYVEGLTGYTDPEYEIKGNFTNDGYITGTWTRIDKSQTYIWQNVTKEINSGININDYEDGIKINDNKQILYLEDKDYLDLHYGSISGDNLTSLESGFKIYKDGNNPIFEIANFKRYIYITQEEKTADLQKLRELKTKFLNKNNLKAVNKVNFCIQIEYAKQILNNNKNLTVNDYQKAKSYFKNALQIFPNDSYVKVKINLMDKKINETITNDFNSISFDIDKKNYKDVIKKLDKFNEIAKKYPDLQIQEKLYSIKNKLTESINNQFLKLTKEADYYLKDIKSTSAEKAINKVKEFIYSYSKYIEKNNRIIELENKLKVVKILEKKYFKITQKIIELEFSFKAPPEKSVKLSSKKIKKLKKAYGEDFVNFNKTYTKEKLSKFLFPADNIILEYLYFKDNQKKSAVIYDDNNKFIYSSLRKTIFNAMQTINNEIDINKNIKNADMLFNFLNKYSFILSKEDKEIKKINKKFETLENTDEIILYLKKL